MVDSKEWRDAFLRRAQAKGPGEADFVPILLDLQGSLQAPHERLKKTAKWEKFREICTLRRDVLTLQDFITFPKEEGLPSWIYITFVMKEKQITLARAKKVLIDVCQDVGALAEFESAFKRLVQLLKDKSKE